MKEFPVVSGALDRVAHSVPEVENRTFTRTIAFVFRHNLRFYLDVATNELLQCKWSPRRACLPLLKRIEHFFVGDDGVLDNLSEPLIEFASWHRLQDIDIINHQCRMMHRADQVFPVARVDSGFSADGAVHHSQ